jgi:hypothetical protein
LLELEAQNAIYTTWQDTTFYWIYSDSHSSYESLNVYSLTFNMFLSYFQHSSIILLSMSWERSQLIEKSISIFSLLLV